MKPPAQGELKWPSETTKALITPPQRSVSAQKCVRFGKQKITIMMV